MLAFLAALALIVGGIDRDSAIVSEQIRSDPPQIALTVPMQWDAKVTQPDADGVLRDRYYTLPENRR